LLSATTKTKLFRQSWQQQRLRLKWRKCNDVLTNYSFKPVAIETPCVYGKSTAPFLSGLARKLVDMYGDPVSDNGSTSTCPWL